MAVLLEMRASDTFFNKKCNSETSQNHYVFELTGSNSLFIFSLALCDINFQNIPQQTKVITFIEKASSAKHAALPCIYHPVDVGCGWSWEVRGDLNTLKSG